MARIWIVEDNPKIGMLIEMTMRKASHEPLHMLDASALERTMKKTTLPDLMLREKSGCDILREWKQQAQTKHIPILIISARSAERDKVQECCLIALGYALWTDILVSPEPEEPSARQARSVLLLIMDTDRRLENLFQMAAIRSMMTVADLGAIAAAQIPSALADRLIYSDHWQQTAE